MKWNLITALQLLISLRACEGGDYVIEAQCSGEQQCRMLQELFETRIPGEINSMANTTINIPRVDAVVIQDFNECDNSLSFCSINARCENIFRTFSCTCLQGYINVASLNGSIGCTDIDECENPSLNDCSTHETCVNTIGSYKCSCQLNGTDSTNSPCLDVSTMTMQSSSNSSINFVTVGATTLNKTTPMTTAIHATTSTIEEMNATIATVTNIDGTIPTTTTTEPSVLKITNIDTTTSITTRADSTIPTNTNIDTTPYVITRTDSTNLTTTSIDANISTTTTTEPSASVITNIESTIPTNTSIDTTPHVITRTDSTDHTTTSIDVNIPTTTTTEPSVSVITNIDTTTPITTKADSTIPTNTSIDTTPHVITRTDSTIPTDTSIDTTSNVITRTDSTIPTDTSIDTTSNVITRTASANHTTASIDANIPTTTTNESSASVITNIDTTTSITTRADSTIPTDTSNDTTIPTNTSLNATSSITRSIDETIPTTTSLDTAILSSTINDTTISTTTSVEATIPTATSIDATIPTSTIISSTASAVPTETHEVTIDPITTTDEYRSVLASILSGNISTEAALELLSNISDLLSRESVDNSTAVQLILLFDAFASSEAQFAPEVFLEITKLVDLLLLTMQLDSGVFQQKRNRLTVAAIRVNGTSSNLVFSIASGLSGSSSPSITLPPNLPFSTADQRISFVGYNDSKLFHSPGASGVVGSSFDLSSVQTPSVINSAVVGASLKETVAVNLQHPVSISLSTFVRKVSSVALDNDTVLKTSLYNPRCVFFDYELGDGLGDWSADGCVTELLSDGFVQCSCNHLTSFAVLMSVDKASDDGVLTTLTIVGCSLSIVGLFLSILTYSLFRHLRKHKSKQILLNFCIALFGVYVTYIFGIALSLPATQGQCVASGFFLHFFTAATFAWMLMEVLDMYLMFVKVWSGTHHTIGKVCAFAWGFPLLLTIATLGAHFALVQAHPGSEWYRMYPFYRETGVCWISTLAIYWAFLLPMGIILLINVILFSVVIYHVTCKRAKTSLARMRSNSQHVKAKQHVLNATAILLLSGPTWVIGFLINIDPIQDGVTRRILSYVFVLFNAFQGLWIFIVFTVRPRVVRSAWMGLFRGKRSFNSSTRGFGRRGTKSGTSNSYLSRTNRRKSSATDTIRTTVATGVANGAFQASSINSTGQIGGKPSSSPLQQLYRYQ